MIESGKRKYSAAGICDFCGVREARHSVNDDLWWVCDRCMHIQMVEIPRVIKECLEEEE